MIECSDEFIWYKKHKKFSAKGFFCVVLSLIILSGIFLYYKFFVVINVYNFCEQFTKVYATEAINEAILDSLNDSLKYSELINVEKNNNGEIVLISANSYKINVASQEIVETTKRKLGNKLKKGVPIPMLAFSGLGVLSGYGKIIDFKTLSVTSVVCDFVSEFKSVGINQTLHSIYATVTSCVIIELPFDRREQVILSNVLMCETVLIGKVPEVYLTGRLIG